jgi:YD repeat-containing protein
LASERREERHVYHGIDNWVYDETGNLTGFASDGEGDGIVDHAESWLYRRAKLMQHEVTDFESGLPQLLATWQYDLRANPVLQEFYEPDTGQVTDVKRWKYNAQGKLTRFERTGGENLAIDFFYGEAGNLRRSEEARDFLGGSPDNELPFEPDGIPDVVETRYYDALGHLTKHVEEGRLFDPWGDWEGGDPFREGKVTVNYRYDTRGKLTRELVDEDGDGTDDRIIRYTYDSDGRQVRREVDDDGDGAIDEVEAWQYDARGKLVRSTTDTGGDGSLERVWAWVYDGSGRLLRHTRDDNADGVDDYVETREYDSAGHLVREATADADNDGEDEVWEYQYNDGGVMIRAQYLVHVDQDGVLDTIEVSRYQPSGWGHLLPPPRLEPENFFAPQ